MGDRCYLRIRVKTADVPKAIETLGVEHEYDDPEIDDFDTVWLTAEQSNYGQPEDRQRLASLGVDFEGWHGEGGGYGPLLFVALGGNMVEVDNLHDSNHPCAEILPSGEPDSEQLAHALRYYALRDDLYAKWEEASSAAAGAAQPDCLR